MGITWHFNTTPEVIPGKTKMGILPPAESVEVGETFDVIVYIDPTPAGETVAGWKIDLLEFTQGKANATLVYPGDEWDDGYNPDDRATSTFDWGYIHNDTGNITAIQTYKLFGYPSYNHTGCIITFEAVSYTHLRAHET